MTTKFTQGDTGPAFWRRYLRDKRAAHLATEKKNQHQRVVPPKRGKGSYNRRVADDG